MTILFLIFLVLVVYHFVVESIIAPSERSKIRLELFALRDQIRMAKIEYGHNFDNELYDHLQSHTNKSIHMLHHHNIVGAWQAIRSMATKDDLYKRVIERQNRFNDLLENTAVQGLEDIHGKTMWELFKGFLFNSLGWLPYVSIPLLIGAFVLFATSMFASARKRFSNAATGLLEMPDGEFRRFFPSAY